MLLAKIRQAEIACDDRYPPSRGVDRDADDGVVFRPVQIGRFAGRAAHDQGAGAFLDLTIAKALERGAHIELDCEQSTGLALDYQDAKVGEGEGAIGRAWLTGTPAVHATIADDPSPAGRSAGAAGLTAMVAVPIMAEHGLKAVVVWYF